MQGKWCNCSGLKGSGRQGILQIRLLMNFWVKMLREIKGTIVMLLLLRRVSARRTIHGGDEEVD